MTFDAFEPPAYYGKLPAHGDFISRGFSAEQGRVIDLWLVEWIERARTHWGDEFDQNYRVSQPWLFEGASVTGISIPSLDRVGRLFPMFALVHTSVRLQSLYDKAVAAISEGWNGDRFQTELGKLDCVELTNDVAGWLVPDEGKTALPHPASCTNFKALSDLVK